MYTDALHSVMLKNYNSIFFFGKSGIFDVIFVSVHRTTGAFGAIFTVTSK